MGEIYQPLKLECFMQIFQKMFGGNSEGIMSIMNLIMFYTHHIRMDVQNGTSMLQSTNGCHVMFNQNFNFKLDFPRIDKDISTIFQHGIYFTNSIN